jgi:hypothetical protein
MSALNVAQRKLQQNNFRFADLPGDIQDPIWNELLKQPYQLSLPELSALKNARIISLGCINSLVIINLFLLIQNFVLLTSRSDKSELSTPCSSISGVDKVLLSPPGTNFSSLSDVTSSSSSIVCSSDEAVESEDVSSVPIPNGIFSREQKTLKKEQFQQLLLQKLTHEKLDQFLQHNFPSMFQLKKKYLDKISEEVKKTRSDAVNVCFEEINKEHITFEPKDIVKLLQDIMEGIHNKRKKRERNCQISENDNSYRKGYLAFLSVVWMELGNDQTYC